MISVQVVQAGISARPAAFLRGQTDSWQIHVRRPGLPYYVACPNNLAGPIGGSRGQSCGLGLSGHVSCSWSDVSCRRSRGKAQGELGTNFSPGDLPFWAKRLLRKSFSQGRTSLRKLQATGNSQLSVADSGVDEVKKTVQRKKKKTSSESERVPSSDEEFLESEGEDESRDDGGAVSGSEEVGREGASANGELPGGSSSKAPAPGVKTRTRRKAVAKDADSAGEAEVIPKRRARVKGGTIKQMLADRAIEEGLGRGSEGSDAGGDISGSNGQVNFKDSRNGIGSTDEEVVREEAEETKIQKRSLRGKRGKGSKAEEVDERDVLGQRRDTDKSEDTDGEWDDEDVDEEDEDDIHRRILREEGVELATLDPTFLKQQFVEVIMECGRRKDPEAAEQALADMKLAGLSPGPRAHHAVVVAHTLAGDFYGAIDALKRILMLNLPPLQETLIAVIRLCGAKRQLSVGESILGLMGELQMSPRVAWCTFVEELWNAGDHKAANELYLKGMKSGLTSPFLASDWLTDRLVEGNCQLRDHGAAVDILDAMQERGRRMTTFHFNCLLMAQSYAGMPEICLKTLERMTYTTREALQKERESCRPDVESYNWILHCYARQERNPIQDAVQFIGLMGEDYKRVQPNARTYSLLVEIFAKSGDMWMEAERHLLALLRFPGSLHLLNPKEASPSSHPLTLLLRLLCRTGSIPLLVDVLDVMVKDSVELPSGAMRIEPKGRRTLVTSWMYPLNEEPDYGVEIDYSARFVADGGVEGTRSDWKEHRGDWRLKQTDVAGFWKTPPVMAFSERAKMDDLSFKLKLLKRLQIDGPSLVGEDVSKEDVVAIQYHLMKDYVWEVELSRRKVKAASKMLVGELRAELEGQGLPTEGKRQELYWRVQKARRLNVLRGRPLWLPTVSKPEEETPERVLELISKLNLRGWYKSYEDVLKISQTPGQPTVGELRKEIADNREATRRRLRAAAAKSVGDGGPEGEEEYESEEDRVEELDDEEEVVEDTDEGVEGSMLARLMEETVHQKRLRQHLEREDKQAAAQRRLEEDPNYAPLLDDSLPLLPQLELEGLMTLETAWNHHWEKALKESPPPPYSETIELDFGIRIFNSVLALGGRPSEADCVLLLRRAAEVGRWQALLPVIQRTRALQHPLHSNLLEDLVQACLDLASLDAGAQEQAKLILNEMVSMGMEAPEDLLREVRSPPLDDGH